MFKKITQNHVHSRKQDVIKTQLILSGLFHFGLVPAPSPSHLSHSASCFSQILTCLEETTGLLKTPRTAYQQKDIRNINGELHRYQ